MTDEMMSILYFPLGLVALATELVGGRAAIPCCR